MSDLKIDTNFILDRPKVILNKPNLLKKVVGRFNNSGFILTEISTLNLIHVNNAYKAKYFKFNYFTFTYDPNNILKSFLKFLEYLKLHINFEFKYVLN